MIGLHVVHVVLDCEEAVLRSRIATDTVEAEAPDWRIRHIANYQQARAWMLSTANIVVDTTEMTPDGVAEALATRRADRR